MRIQSLVLDFDGTFTDVVAEAAPFQVAFKEKLQALVGEPSFDERWRELEAEIRASPGTFGWRYEGHIVAPATADPYIMSTTIADLLLERVRNMVDPRERSHAIQAIYHAAYTSSSTCFRPEAKEVLSKILADRVPTFVITNARTDMVEKKLARLLPGASDRLTVLGDAGKYIISEPVTSDPLFDRLPQSFHVSGLERPILLRRGRYFEALKTVWARSGGQPATTLVVGDIFELDLALPSALGAKIHLVMREDTSEHERRAATARDNGGASLDLSAVLMRLAS